MSHHSSKVLSDSKSKVTFLPKLMDNKFQLSQNLLVENPFFVPPDSEIFQSKEKEKETRKEQREINSTLKIWEKGIKRQKAARSKLLSNLNPIKEDNEDSNTNKINIVEAAKMAIKNKVRQKESMHKFVEKKREMFLFQMLIDHKREQINQFEELSKLQERGLQKAELMLEEDLAAFNDYFDKNKSKSRAAIKRAEVEDKLKQDKINEMKGFTEKKAELMTKNTQKIDKLTESVVYKNFLEGITPKEFIEQQKKKQLERRAKRQKEKEKMKKTENSSESNEKKKNEIKFENYIKLDKSLMELLEDSDEEFEIYFKTPDQIEKYFESLEERSLFLISNTKETEQLVENIKVSYEETKKKLNEQLAIKTKMKSDLLKNVNLVEKDIQALKMTKNGYDASDMLNKLTLNIGYEYKILLDKVPELKSELGLLAEIEKNLDELLNSIKGYRLKNKEMLENKMKESNKDRFETNRKLAETEKKNSEAAQNSQKKDEVFVKRTGRPIMRRSWLMEDKEEESETESIDPEQQEILDHLT